jgi:CheY-like chemotaxis protein
MTEPLAPPLAAVMVVDDNPRMRALVAAIVGPLAHRVVELPDGQEAIEQYDAIRPDWVLMDLVMPRRDGISATGEIVHRHPDARVLIVTEHQDPRLRRDALRAGARGLLTKDELTQLPDVLARL